MFNFNHNLSVLITSLTLGLAFCGPVFNKTYHGSQVTLNDAQLLTKAVTNSWKGVESLQGYKNGTDGSSIPNKVISLSDNRELGKTRSSDFHYKSERMNKNATNQNKTPYNVDSIKAVRTRKQGIVNFNQDNANIQRTNKHEYKVNESTGEHTVQPHHNTVNSDLGIEDHNYKQSQVGLTHADRTSGSFGMFYSCCKLSDTRADCTGCGFNSVPPDLPQNITELILTSNFITSDALYPGVFSNFAELTVLRLDSNKISDLNEGIFDGLENLKVLNLYNNNIILNYDLNYSKVFYPLSNSLEVLIMNKNTNDEGQDIVYPDYALSVLKSLTRLHIDGLKNQSFGKGFRNLGNLTHLSLAGFPDGYCHMTCISNHTFQHLRRLTYLNISGCNLNASCIELNAFGHLSHLEVLDVSNNTRLGLEAVGNFMYGLRNNKNFSRLKMQRIVTRFSPCVIIYNYTLRYFKDTGLQVIEAMNNEIEMIEFGALEMLPKTLKEVNVTNNRIMFGAYWRDMASLTGLEVLHLDGYLNPEQFPLFFPSKNLHCPVPEIETVSDNLVESDNNEKTCICGPGICSHEKDEFMLPLPPNLIRLTMHGNSLSYNVNNIKFCSTNKLASVDLVGNMFPQLEGPIVGLNNIQYLNLSSCFIQTIEDHFFDNLTSLVYLNLFQNLLGDRVNNDTDGYIFDRLNNLKYLNLSFNNIYKLNPKTFKDLNDVEFLDLSTNRLSHLNVTVNHMKHLKFLDLHKNDLTDLPIAIRELVDLLLKEKKNVTIDMRQNPIYCDCSNLDFLEWVVNRREVFGDNYTYYYCKFPTENQNAVEMPHGYDTLVAKLRRQCSTNVGLFLGVIGATFLLMAFIVGLLLYRFRWTLRYWYHAAKMKMYTNPHQVGDEFEYDVFVSYASEDVDFVLQELSPHLSAEMHLKLMVHGENFQAGRHIADNIYNAVRQCRKTLVLVTRNMLTSHWCTYELQMARMESISRGRDVLLFLFLEEIPDTLMNAQVLSYIRTSTYISYPREAQHRAAFWNKLADDLRAV